MKKKHNISRRSFMRDTALGATGACALHGMDLGANEKRGRRPNVLVIFSDQQHWQAMGCVDAFFDTPHQDRLAGMGVRFENAYCTTPQCSPSRSSLLTGFYPSKTGVWGNVGAAGGSPLKQPTLAAAFREAGYHTGYFGKWHLGNQPIAAEGWDVYRPDAAAKQKGRRQHVDERATRAAVRFLQETGDTDKPFLAIASYVNPHDIYGFRKHRQAGDSAVPFSRSWREESFTGKPRIQRQFMEEDQGKAIRDDDEQAWARYRDCYRAKVKLYDNHVGKILKALEDSGQLGNTIVVLTSDHGDMDTNHRLIFKGPFMYEHMLRIPLVVRVPEQFGGINGRTLAEPYTVNVDIVPTLMDLCGLGVPDCDGLSLKPVLTGSPGQEQRSAVVTEYYSKQRWVNPIRSIRADGFKYNRVTGDTDELYDLRSDPEELTNLIVSPTHGEVRRRLSAQLDNWMSARNDPFSQQVPTTRDGTPRTSG